MVVQIKKHSDHDTRVHSNRIKLPTILWEGTRRMELSSMNSLNEQNLFKMKANQNIDAFIRKGKTRSQ